MKNPCGSPRCSCSAQALCVPFSSLYSKAEDLLTLLCFSWCHTRWRHIRASVARFCSFCGGDRGASDIPSGEGAVRFYHWLLIYLPPETGGCSGEQTSPARSHLPSLLALGLGPSSPGLEPVPARLQAWSGTWGGLQCPRRHCSADLLLGVISLSRRKEFSANALGGLSCCELSAATFGSESPWGWRLLGCYS